MEALTVKTVTKKLLKTDPQIKKLYYSAFPRNELLPFYFLKWRMKKEYIDFLAFYNGNTFIGFVYGVTYEDITFIAYIAISEKLRGCGYGSLILGLLANKYKQNRIALLIEEVDQTYDDYEKRQARKNFYEKNGYERCDFIVQEQRKLYFEPYCIRGKISKPDYANLMKVYLSPFIYKISTIKILDNKKP